MISSYMLPDGVHKHENDISIFRCSIDFKDNKDGTKYFFYNLISKKKDNKLKRGF